MINDDTIVKYSIKRLEEDNFTPDQNISDWVDYTRFLKEQIQYIKLGFTGLGDGDISLISNQQVVLGDRIIIDDNLDSNCGVHNTDHAAIMGVIKKCIDPMQGIFEMEITAIGQGYDFSRDPDRNIYNPGKTILFDLSKYRTILRVDAKPRPDGGSLYYFFNKSVLDGRY